MQKLNMAQHKKFRRRLSLECRLFQYEMLEKRWGRIACNKSEWKNIDILRAKSADLLQFCQNIVFMMKLMILDKEQFPLDGSKAKSIKVRMLTLRQD